MKRLQFLSVGLLAAALVFGMLITGCQADEEWGGDDPSIKDLRITGQSSNVDFGKASSNPDDAQAGSVTLLSKKKNENGVSVVVGVSITADTAASTTLTYAVTGSKTTPPNTYTGTVENLKNNDYLWIKVTPEGGSPLYYVIKITVLDSAFAFKYHPASQEKTLEAWNDATEAQKTLSVEMEETGAYEYQWYSNTVFSNTGGAAINGEANASYTPSISANGTYYYYVTVTQREQTITSNVAVIRIGSIEPAITAFQIGDTRLNYVRGVGGTGSFMFREGGNADASPDADVNYIDLLMGEIGCNILRIMVQDSYEEYITNSIQSRNSATFYHNAKDNFFPVIRRVNEYGGYVFANPWTAPATMKANNSLAGGILRVDSPNYVDYAEHLRGFLKWLNDHNAPIFALGILNEPDYGQNANYEGMGMSATVTRDWFKTVGNFTTQTVTDRNGAGTSTSVFDEDIIPGYGGGARTHHVLAMSGDSMGGISAYMNPQIDDKVSNNNIELMGRHYYAEATRYTKVVGQPPHSSNPTAWFDRPQLNYEGPYEAESIRMSPQMYAPGSEAGNIKREVWQTEHDHNYHSNSTTPPPSNVQNYWNSAFAALNDTDWCLRVVGESVFCWWYTSSYSGMVTSYQPAGFPPYTITPRGRAFAHYARYVNETWLLPITRIRGDINFNTTTGTYNAGSTDPKISAFEDVNGKFISLVMYTPPTSTNNGSIASSFGTGGTNGRDDPTYGSVNVGKIEINLPDGFIAYSASGLRTYGNNNATADDAAWVAANPVPAGNPRYWIDEPVFVSADGTAIELTLPAGNVISVMVKGKWTDPGDRHFEERVRPYTVK